MRCAMYRIGDYDAVNLRCQRPYNKKTSPERLCNAAREMFLSDGKYPAVLLHGRI